MKNLKYLILLLALCTALSAENSAHAATSYGGSTIPQPYKSDAASAGGSSGGPYILPIQVFQVKATTTAGTNNIAASSSIQTPDTYFFYRSLVPGSTGTGVVQLQRRLNLEGFFKGPVTGYFGNLTLAAVREYQKAHNIVQLGVVGPLTRASLNSSK